MINKHLHKLSLRMYTYPTLLGAPQVSWDETVGPGSTFSLDDTSVTHQIVDRPGIDQKHLSRYYVQPQWIYDSINARTQLPVQEYFPGQVRFVRIAF